MTIDRTFGLSILWVYAHPDDEAMGNAGCMFHARSEGMATGLICATRGENGEISDPRLATPEILGAVRERELRRAMDRTGLDELRLLDYRDSGMNGTPENQDPRTLHMADETALVASLVMHIRELRPAVVVTFGQDGVYGHPDHLRIGAATDTAVIEAAAHDRLSLGDPWQVTALYHAAAPREAFIELRNNADSPFRTVPLRIVEKFGVPSSEITHWVDTSMHGAAKVEVIRCHATQFAEDHPMFDIESLLARTWLSREQFRQVVVYIECGPDPIDELANRFPATPFKPCKET
jgi:N-acetyl-1-D-myo-inositol-2-amino-2-deoxy-alpha-D-glucopyranoside deacetylase